MKAIELIRLIKKHLRLLFLIPLLLAGLVILLTRKPHYSYTSQTILYTGLATGSSVEMDKTFNYFVTNTAFDNLINIINSRETQEEVAIRLLSEHLLLNGPKGQVISAKSYDDLKEIIPGYLYKYVVKTKSNQTKSPSPNSDNNDDIDTSSDVSDTQSLIPSLINMDDYEKTVSNLTRLMKSSDTNFVYRLLNNDDPHYSLKALSTIKAERIANSDLIKLSFEADDPGICQQTLAFFNQVCKKNYKYIKENRSDEVVKYFQRQLSQANQKLNEAENKLLVFNKDHNIINYYEQSKAVAIERENLLVDFNDKKAQLEGLKAAIKRLEDKLSVQQLVQLRTSGVLDKKKELGDLNYKIAAEEVNAADNQNNSEKLNDLQKQADKVKNDIRKSIDDLYTYQNTTDGLPVNQVLTDWINNVVAAENLKAKLSVMDQSNKDYQEQYATYAPAGATTKKIEREISVAEQGYLEILHGLNLAKLKLQDNDLAANLRTVDPPYFPITPTPTKRAVLIIVAGVLGFILTLGIILMMEYTDNTLKNIKKASGVLRLPAIGIFPKILLHPHNIDLSVIQNRLMDLAVQNLDQSLSTQGRNSKPKIVLFASMLPTEGKSMLAANFATKFLHQGKKVILLNYKLHKKTKDANNRYLIINKILGYPDPRIDFDNKLFEDPSTYLEKGTYYTYTADDVFARASNYVEILRRENINVPADTDYLFIELPPMLSDNYPAGLAKDADMVVLVCRSNRIWSDADRSALDHLQKLSGDRIYFILNGANLKETEAVLGELPKHSRARLKKKLINFVSLQFYNRNQF